MRFVSVSLFYCQAARVIPLGSKAFVNSAIYSPIVPAILIGSVESRPIEPAFEELAAFSDSAHSGSLADSSWD